MRSPELAVLWETWRLTRSRLLFVPLLATLCSWAVSRSPAKPFALVILLVAGLVIALALPVFGTRRSFPLSMAFARPIRTSSLVAVPFMYVVMLAAACYFVPALLLRAFADLALPLASPAALIAVLAALVAGCTWFTRIEAVRLGLVFAAYVAAGAMLRFLDPFKNAGGFPIKLGPQLCAISPVGYMVVALFIAGVYAWILFGVSRQRRGDEEPSWTRSNAFGERENRADIFSWLRNASVEVFRWRCPVSSPTAAEVWFEMQCYGVPVLIIGALLSFCIPVLMWAANKTQSAIPLVMAAATVLFPFMAGVGASIWNRRNSARARVFVFEAARPMGTGKLIALQVLTTSLCISGAWILMLTSTWLSLPLLREFHDYGSPVALAMEAIHRHGLRTASFVAVCFVLLAAALAFLTAFRAFASSYGWRFWFSAWAVGAYSVGISIAVASDLLDGAVLGAHFWALAMAIPLATLLVIGKIRASGILSSGQLAVISLAWLLFAAFYLDLLRAGGALSGSPAVEALAFASTLLPLLAAALAPWSISSLRHA
jgi:hypothetical protein